MLQYLVKSLSIFSLFLVLISTPITRAQICTPPPSGLVAWYKGEANVNDSSGNGHHGAGSFSVGFSAGHVGQAFTFSDQTQSVPIPNHPNLFPPTSLSIEGWINPLPYSGCSGGSYRIFHTVQTVITGYATILNCTDGKLIGALFDSAGTPESVVSNLPIPTNTFTHFAVTWDGSNLRLYINGVLDNVAPTTMPTIGTNDHFLRIGNGQAIGFLGKIDEVSLYNRALSGVEVSAIFNAGTAGKCFAPTAATVSIGGRALTAGGRGISMARVTLQDQAGNVRAVLTNPFGHYRFDDVATGGTVLLSVAAKGREFIDPSRVIGVKESVSNIDFITVD